MSAGESRLACRLAKAHFGLLMVLKRAALQQGAYQRNNLHVKTAKRIEACIDTDRFGGGLQIGGTIVAHAIAQISDIVTFTLFGEMPDKRP